jgi:hypothetical protein
MPDPTAVTRDLMAVLAKHGVTGLPSAVTQPSGATTGPQLGGAAASYIREIITGNQAFDEQMLGRVANVLSKGSGQ